MTTANPQAPAQRGGAYVGSVTFAVGMLSYILAIQPVAWLVGLAPGDESVATGRVYNLVNCETRLGQLWVIRSCVARVTWSDGRQQERVVESMRVLTGDVDVVERREQNEENPAPPMVAGVPVDFRPPQLVGWIGCSIGMTVRPLGEFVVREHSCPA